MLQYQQKKNKEGKEMEHIKPNHGAIDGDILRGLVERLERLHEQHDAINAGMSEIYNEAKSAGYDPKFIKKVIKLRASDPDKVSEYNELLKMYCNAIGVQMQFDFG